MGLEPENLVVVGGPNKSGKTTFAVNTVATAIENDKRVLVLTTEVSGVQYLLRLACRGLRVSLKQIRGNTLSPKQAIELEKWLDLMRYAPLTVIEKPLCTFEEVDLAVSEVLPDLLVVDHLQRLSVSGDNAAWAFKELSLQFKNLAVSFGIPVLLLSQVGLGQGWCNENDAGELEYDFTQMVTRWSREPLGEGDKILFLHNLAQSPWRFRYPDQSNVIIHSQRDYDSGDVFRVWHKLEHQFVGSKEAYGKRYGYPIHETLMPEVEQAVRKFPSIGQS